MQKDYGGLSRLSNFAFSWMIMRRILRESCSSQKAKDYHVINFPLSFLDHEIPILIIIAQMLCNDTWSRYNVCDCCFMMTCIQSFPRNTWHCYATVMRVFIMCTMGEWDERKLCLVSPYVPIPQRECQLDDIQKTDNRYRYELAAVTNSALILCKRLVCILHFIACFLRHARSHNSPPFTFRDMSIRLPLLTNLLPSFSLLHLIVLFRSRSPVGLTASLLFPYRRTRR